MTEQGYEADRVFNTTNGHRRLLYYDVPHQRQVDVFVGAFEMCHAIPITERIELHPTAVPLAELLLTKMQIVELNAKDQSDIVTMLYHHDVGESDDGVINARRVAQLCAGRLGPVADDEDERRAHAPGAWPHGVAPEVRAVAEPRLERLWDAIESAPKSGRWKMRNRVGDKVRWYEEPEEVG